MRLHPTGTATVITGSSAHGQGHATTWSQIVESELGIPFADIDVLHGDTQYSPYGIGTFGSRSLAVGGTALQLSCVKVREKARLLAAHMLECAPDDLEWSRREVVGQGLARAREDDPGARGRGLAGELAARGHGAEPRGRRRSSTRRTSRSRSARTSPRSRSIRETGKVTIERYTAVDDCGNVVNPMIVEGQVHGGIAQSIAQALYEETVYDDDGQMLTGTLVDYMIPSAAELPHFDLGAHGDAVADEPARRQGHRRGGHDRRVRGRRQRRRRRGRATSASGTSRCRCSPRASGRRCRREVARDPRGVRLRAAGHRSTRP